MNNSEESRLRVPPVQRFAGPQHAFDLKQIAQDLRAEAHAGQSGHRQITLLQHGAVTMVAFAFESGGSMPEHSAQGLVTIQIIEGDFEIATSDETHHLKTGSMLVLWPNVRHNATAVTAGTMLLTVTMEKTD